MNEQERLQRVIDILADNAHEMCAVEGDSNNIILDANMDGVQTVAKEIVAIFKQPQKDTRSRRECALDFEFERVGVKPIVYHFIKEVYPFSAITIAHTIWTKIVIKHMLDDIFIHNSLWIRGCSPATQMFQELASKKVYGVAICDKSDVFSRREGRNKAKGRLMQHLLKEANKK